MEQQMATDGQGFRSIVSAPTYLGTQNNLSLSRIKVRTPSVLVFP